MTIEKILILDDEPVVCRTLEHIFFKHRCQVTCVTSLAAAESSIRSDGFDLIVADVCLPDGNGIQILEWVKDLANQPLVVVASGYGSIESAVACMRAGAFDYLLKPFSLEQIELIVKKASFHRQLMQVNRYLNNAPKGESEMLGISAVMQRLQQTIKRVALTDATVLITGENGTGKEMIARELFRNSARKGQSYIKVNCAAIAENLIESEFFGYEKGAFTGATQRRQGRFELAHGGTLLLDEVSEIPLHLQAKLLRVLQEREFERVGGEKSIKVDVRIIATSNRDLLQCLEKGTFRQDLYYRLNVFPFHAPPLRERPEDIMPLAEYFLRRSVRRFGCNVLAFSDVAQTALKSYSWPGNIRELQNTIERAVILTEPGRPISSRNLGLPICRPEPGSGFAEVVPIEVTPMPEPIEIRTPHISPDFFDEKTEGINPTPNDLSPTAVVPFSSALCDPILPLHELKKRAILAALRQTNGNRIEAARLLKISIRTLGNKIQEYRDDEEFPPFQEKNADPELISERQIPDGSSGV